MENEFDVIDTALAAGQFSTLATALGAAGLIDTLKGPGPFTVFAPTDDAFAKLPPQLVSDLLQPEKKEKLKNILFYHVLPGKLTAHDIFNLDGGSPTTLQGQPLQAKVSEGLKINDAKVLIPDVEAINGVIHVIDTVLLPAPAAVAS